VTRRIFDCFPFAGELDLLECRLAELYDCVHRFVLAESPVTYSGLEKPLYYQENAGRFERWADKITYIVVDTSAHQTAPSRENAQRNALRQGLEDFGAGDVLVTGDADEIPHPQDLAEVASQWPFPVCKILHRHHPVAVNLRDSTFWGGYVPHLGLPVPDLMELRQRLHSRLIPEVEGNGWHFSWLGGPDAMKAKAATLCEPDYLPKMLNGAEDFYRNRVNPGSGDRSLAVAEIDGTWPRFMQERRGPAYWYWPGEQSPAS
jgi:beta-1,4-mannosyl-glycoprotein beta-1,4-N-acetylglucosaminyltransferase